MRLELDQGGFMVGTGWAYGWFKVGLEWLRVGEGWRRAGLGWFLSLVWVLAFLGWGVMVVFWVSLGWGQGWFRVGFCWA